MSESNVLPDRPIRFVGDLRDAIGSALGFSEEWGRPSVLYPSHEQTWLIEPVADEVKSALDAQPNSYPCSVFLYDTERDFHGMLHKGDRNG